MAVYRQVHISFWQDPDVLELTPEQKYFYLYLMTNSKTRQCGCYEISPRVVQLETGYNGETIDKLINNFVNMGKVKYCPETREVLLLNWYKHNRSTSPKITACIKKEVDTIKNKQFKKYCIDTLLYSIDTDPQKEKEEEEEKEEEVNPCPYEKIKNLYNETCTMLPQIKTISDTRKTHIKARWNQYDCNLTTFKELFNKAANSEFLTGDNDRKWKADFDWLMNENNMTKVLEDKYKNKADGKAYPEHQYL